MVDHQDISYLSHETVRMQISIDGLTAERLRSLAYSKGLSRASTIASKIVTEQVAIIAESSPEIDTMVQLSADYRARKTETQPGQAHLRLLTEETNLSE